MSGSDDAHRLVLRGAFATGAGFLVKLGARLGFLLIAGRLFGAATFGAYSIGVAAVESGVGFAGLSLKKVIFQLLDANAAGESRPATHVVADACLLVLAASGVLALAIMAVTAAVAGRIPVDGAPAALFWLAPTIAGQTLVDVILAASRWRHAIRYEVIGRSIVEPYTQLAVAIAGWWAGVPGWALIAGYWAGNITVNGYALAGLRRCYGPLRLASYRPDRRRLFGLARSLAPNTATEVLGGVYTRADLYIVGALLGARWAGIYSMAQQVRTPLRQVRQSFDGLLVPLVARTLAERGSAATAGAIAAAVRFLLAVQMPFLLAIVAFGQPLLGSFGPGFERGYTALVLLAAAEALQGSLGLGDLLFVYLLPGAGLRMAGIAFAAGIALVLLLTPPLGIAGAAAAMLVATSLQAMLRRRTLSARLAHRVPLAFGAPPVLAGLAALAAVLALRGPGAATGFSPWDAAVLAVGLGLYALLLAGWLWWSGERLSMAGLSQDSGAGRA